MDDVKALNSGLLESDAIQERKKQMVLNQHKINMDK